MTIMRKLMAVLAAISTVVLTVLVAPTPAQAATCTVVAHVNNGGNVGVGPDGTIGIYGWVTPSSGCHAVKTTKLTVVLPRSDMVATRNGKTVSMPISLGKVAAGRPVAGTDYTVKMLVTFTDNKTATGTTKVHFQADTKINASIAAREGGRMYVSGTLYRYSWTDVKPWVPLAGKKVGWYINGKSFTPTTNSSGKFSANMDHLPKGMVFSIKIAFAETKTYDASVRTLQSQVK